MSEDLLKKLEEYKDVKLLADGYKKKADKLGLEIKELMEKEPKISHNGYAYERRISVKEKLNEDRLSALLEEQGVLEAFKMVKVLDEDKVSELIKEGVIELSTIAECTESKESVALYMKKEKEKVEKKDGE